MNHEITITLRKYFPIQLYVLQNIINQQLTFSNPLHFNDPFDCYLLKNDDILKESDISDEEKKALQSLRVLCLFQYDKNKDNTKENRYFWSFYGESHKGICIEFELKILENIEELKDTDKQYYIFDRRITEGDFLLKNSAKQPLIYYSGLANYQDNFLQHIPYIKRQTNLSKLTEIIDNFVFLKDDVFEDECEYRIISLDPLNQSKDFVPFSIKNCKKNIIFGSRCDNSLKKIIYNSSKEYYDNFLYVNEKMEEVKYGI